MRSKGQPQGASAPTSTYADSENETPSIATAIRTLQELSVIAAAANCHASLVSVPTPTSHSLSCERVEATILEAMLIADSDDLVDDPSHFGDELGASEAVRTASQ